MELDAFPRSRAQGPHEGGQCQHKAERDNAGHQGVVEPEPRQTQIQRPPGRHKAGAKAQEITERATRTAKAEENTRRLPPTSRLTRTAKERCQGARHRVAVVRLGSRA